MLRAEVMAFLVSMTSMALVSLVLESRPMETIRTSVDDELVIKTCIGL